MAHNQVIEIPPFYEKYNLFAVSQKQNLQYSSALIFYSIIADFCTNCALIKLQPTTILPFNLFLIRVLILKTCKMKQKALGSVFFQAF